MPNLTDVIEAIDSACEYQLEAVHPKRITCYLHPDAFDAVLREEWRCCRSKSAADAKANEETPGRFWLRGSLVLPAAWLPAQRICVVIEPKSPCDEHSSDALPYLLMPPPNI